MVCNFFKGCSEFQLNCAFKFFQPGPRPAISRNAFFLQPSAVRVLLDDGQRSDPFQHRHRSPPTLHAVVRSASILVMRSSNDFPQLVLGRLPQAQYGAARTQLPADEFMPRLHQFLAGVFQSGLACLRPLRRDRWRSLPTAPSASAPLRSVSPARRSSSAVRSAAHAASWFLSAAMPASAPWHFFKVSLSFCNGIIFHVRVCG